ncbi:MAG: hypothetical protein KJ950_00200 [Proteobacteria bacterium]|nr:hypothetical protein [Pseudomonadota bacterium]MBU1687531.1 hypothetical protein [Pseudomonadota bacterium]
MDGKGLTLTVATALQILDRVHERVGTQCNSVGIQRTDGRSPSSSPLS